MQFNFDLKEYTDELFTTKGVILITLLLTVLLYWVYINFDEKPALIYAIMGVFVFFAALFEYKNQDSELIDVVLFGEKQNMFIGLIAGLIVGFVLVSQAQIIIGTPKTLAATGTFNFLYVVVAAAWMESLFFWGILNPTIMQYLNNEILGILVGSIIFALFHFAAYGGITAFMIGAFIFSVTATYISYVLKSQGFGISLHFINNWLVWVK